MSADPPLAPEVLIHRLGETLVEQNLLSLEGLTQALEYQQARRDAGDPILLGEALVELGLITRPILDAAVTKQILSLRTALEQANQRLERRVRERTAELQAALEKLSTLNQLKSNIVANISHELRTPLTHLQGYIDLLSNHDLGPLNEEQQRAVEVLHRSSDRLARLIEDLILFSMTERNQVTLRLENVDLKRLMAATLDSVYASAAEKNITFDFICPNNLPGVESDREKISWVILQLIDNAIKFTPSGGQVTLQMEPEIGFVRIRVKDTGIGIPVENVDEIFEPFFQLDGSSTRKYGGTGLGLALVKKIITAHGSSIRVDTQPGQGSIFEFDLKTASSSA